MNTEKESRTAAQMSTWKFCLGVGLLGGFIGVPFIRMVLFVARVSGWGNAIEGVMVSLLWGVGVGLGVFLLFESFWQEGQQ